MDLVKSRRAWQFGAALAAVGLTAIAAWCGWWPFDSEPAPAESFENPSIWQYVFSDRKMVGFGRIIIVALALYLVASVPALIIGRRWLRAFGTSGVSVDEAERATETIRGFRSGAAELSAKLDQATQEIEQLRGERDKAREALRNVVRTLTTSRTRPR